MERIKSEITWSTFEELDIRVGTITQAEIFPEARKPAYKIWVDLGPIGVKKSSAQITGHYNLAELVGKQVVCIINLGDKKIGPFVSQLLITGFPDENGNVILTTVDKKVANGAKLF